MTNPYDVHCERVGCKARRGEPCKPIPRFDGQKPAGDPELAQSRFHQVRMQAARFPARENAVEDVRALLASLSADNRRDFFARLHEGYCEHCGWEDPHHACQCWNDE